MPLTKSFKKLKATLFREYLGKPVPSEYQKRYGKRYDKKDIEKLTYAIAKSKGIKIDK